ncbi:substrate-binding periplasmic protein [Simiduia aestuariiviva]|uniref:Polar amino acid transport system substrate-binding protein n=1 Tax=Simiduia aestuariiviva TaxID=1510459 RepID=A0A839ULI5_9GAMM|nr:ABC transporter substrate-binding protein [Simiduia aestuariiviva]MBB3167429.1 polar amino acid transport system substrate-binding protein [Simiduia aestuariiviva]
MLKRFMIGCLAYAVSLPLCAQQFNELVFITESDASLNYIQQGRLQGPAVELLLSASERLGSPVLRKDIRVQPWARGFRRALAGPNAVLFSTIRTPEREAKFQWVGPIASEHDVLIGPKDRAFSLSHVDQLRDLKIGAVKDDVGHEILLELGLDPENIVVAHQVESLSKMLLAGRIDTWVFGEQGWHRGLIASGIDPDSLEVIYRFPARQYYFAFSLDVPPTLVNEFQGALNRLLNEKSAQLDIVK